MRNKFWLVLISLLIILVLEFITNSGSAKADSPFDSTRKVPDLVRSAATIVKNMWAFFGAVGEMAQQVGAVSPHILCLVICLAMPLLFIRVWALMNLGRILGMMALRDNVRSFLRD